MGSQPKRFSLLEIWPLGIPEGHMGEKVGLRGLRPQRVAHRSDAGQQFGERAADLRPTFAAQKFMRVGRASVF